MAGRRASTPTGTSPATAPRTRSCRGTTSRPGCTRTSSGRTGRTPWPSTASPTAGGRPATTAGCAPATASSTSWPRRSPPAGGSQGTGQDLSRGGDGAGRAAGPAGRDAGRRGVTRSALRFTKRGKVRFDSPPRRRPRVRAGVPHAPSCRVAFTEGFSPRPKVSFGLALLDRPRARRRVPRRRARPTSRSTSTRCPAGSTPALPDGHRRRRRPSPVDAGHAVAAGGRHRAARGGIEVAGADLDGTRREPPSPARSAAPTLVVTRDAQGHATVTDDVRPAIRRCRRGATPTGIDARAAELATQPRSRPPGGAARAPSTAARGRRPRCAANPPMDRARRRRDASRCHASTATSPHARRASTRAQ